MTVIDLDTNKVIYKTDNFPGQILWATKEGWSKYVKDVTEWGIQEERKLLYGEY